MIYIDHYLLLEIDQSRSCNVGTFNNEDRVVRRIHRRKHANILGTGKLLICMQSFWTLGVPTTSK